MIFKNAKFYRFTREFHFSPEQIESYCEPLKIENAGGILKKIGFVPAYRGDAAALVSVIEKNYLLRVRIINKVIPSEAVRREIEERMSSIEKENDRKISKKEKMEIREDVLSEFAARAFDNVTDVCIWISLKDNFLMVDTASNARADDALSLLRRAVGSLPVTPIQLRDPAELTLTEWVKEENPPENFSLGEIAYIESIEKDGGSIRAKMDLDSPEIKAALDNSKLVVKLQIGYKETCQFKINRDLNLTSIKWMPEFHVMRSDEVDELETIDAVDDADFMLMTGVMSDLINDLVDNMGGEVTEWQE